MKKNLVFILIYSLFVLSNVYAQNRGGGIDEDRVSFGYSFQYLTSEYKILKNPSWRDPFPDPSAKLGQLNSISSDLTAGLGLMLLAKYKLTNHVDIRLSPAYVFGNDLKFKYTYRSLNPDGSAEELQKITKSSIVEFPLDLKLKSERLLDNFRFYMLGGLKYSLDITSRKSKAIVSEREKSLMLKRNYFSYEAGLGLEIYFQHFKMSPEFKVAYALNDMLKREPNAFDMPIEKAKLRSFTFSLIFE